MALSQNHYHFGDASGTESTYPLLAAANFGVMLPPGRPFLCRVNVQNDASGAANNVAPQWQYRHSRAGAVLVDWTNITTTSAVVRTGATAVFANGANCTKRLAGTGTFETTGAGCTHDGSAGGTTNDIVTSGCSETLIGLQVIGADTAVGDIIELRVVNTATPLGSYPVLPTIRVGVAVLAIQSRDAEDHVSVSVPVTKISGTLVRVRCAGMPAADVADETLTMTMNVYGTTVVGSTDPADYTVHLYGPDVSSGGGVGKAGTEFAGLSIPMGFAFAQDIPEGVRRVLAVFRPNRTVTFGADGTVVELP